MMREFFSLLLSLGVLSVLSQTAIPITNCDDLQQFVQGGPYTNMILDVSTSFTCPSWAVIDVQSYGTLDVLVSAPVTLSRVRVQAQANSIVTFSGQSLTFQGVGAREGVQSGGAVWVGEDARITFNTTTTTFQDLRALDSGGALTMMSRSVVVFNSQITTFDNCQTEGASGKGGAFSAAGAKNGADRASGARLTINGLALFNNNKARYGGGFMCSGWSVCSFNGPSYFENNFADFSGGAFTGAYYATVTFGAPAVFRFNRAIVAAGVFNMVLSKGSFHSSVDFIDNHVLEQDGEGGALEDGGGCLFAEVKSGVTFHGVSRFLGNSAPNDGGAMKALGASHIVFHALTIFSGNYVLNGHGGAIFSGGSTYTFFADTTFEDNFAYTGAGGGIFMDNSQGLGDGVNLVGSDAHPCSVVFETNSSVNFLRNVASRGAAVYSALTDAHLTTTLTLKSHTSFRLNEAISQAVSSVDGAQTLFEGRGCADLDLGTDPNASSDYDLGVGAGPLVLCEATTAATPTPNPNSLPTPPSPALLPPTPAPVAVIPCSTYYLDEGTLTYSVNAGSAIGWDQRVGGAGPLVLSGVTYTKGFSCHAPAEQHFAVAGRAGGTFLAVIGIDDSQQRWGKVRVTVCVDGTAGTCLTSPELTGGGTPWSPSLPIPEDATTLRIITSPDGSPTNDHVTFGESRVAPSASCNP